MIFGGFEVDSRELWNLARNYEIFKFKVQNCKSSPTVKIFFLELGKIRNSRSSRFYRDTLTLIVGIFALNWRVLPELEITRLDDMTTPNLAARCKRVEGFESIASWKKHEASCALKLTSNAEVLLKVACSRRCQVGNEFRSRMHRLCKTRFFTGVYTCSLTYLLFIFRGILSWQRGTWRDIPGETAPHVFNMQYTSLL